MCPEVLVKARLIFTPLDNVLLLKALNSWSNFSINSAVAAHWTGNKPHWDKTFIPFATEWLKTCVANFTCRELNNRRRRCLTVSFSDILVGLLETISWKSWICCHNMSCPPSTNPSCLDCSWCSWFAEDKYFQMKEAGVVWPLITDNNLHS